MSAAGPLQGARPPEGGSGRSPLRGEPGTPVIEARGLSRVYALRRMPWQPAARIVALDGVSFRIGRGETLGVVGESGSGKSTLARLCTLIEAPSAGSLAITGVEASGPDGESARRRLRGRVQMVFQNPYASLNPRKTVEALLTEPLAIEGSVPRAERRARARAALERVGLSAAHLARYPHMFSGGQRQRIAIARALMLEPALLVADEPTSALDVSVQAQVLNLLLDLRDATGIAYLFITHNLEVVRHVADRVLVMYLGRVVEEAGKDALFAAPRHPYTRSLLASTPSIARARRDAVARGEPPSPLAPPSGCAFRIRCPWAAPRCAEERPVLRPVGEGLVACHFAEALPAAE